MDLIRTRALVGRCLHVLAGLSLTAIPIGVLLLDGNSEAAVIRGALLLALVADYCSRRLSPRPERIKPRELRFKLLEAMFALGAGGMILGALWVNQGNSYRTAFVVGCAMLAGASFVVREVWGPRAPLSAKPSLDDGNEPKPSGTGFVIRPPSWRSLLNSYDLYLKRVGEQTRSIYAVRAVALPWMLGVFVSMAAVDFAIRPLNLPRWAFTVLTLIVALVALAGLICAYARAAKYSWLFHRTPQGEAWAKTHTGEILVDALRRSTLHDLTWVGEQTRLKADLKMSGEEVAGMLRELSEKTHNVLPGLAERLPPDPVIKQVLEAISSDETPRSTSLA
jgi:hypothetical protein